MGRPERIQSCISGICKSGPAMNLRLDIGSKSEPVHGENPVLIDPLTLRLADAQAFETISGVQLVTTIS